MVLTPFPIYEKIPEGEVVAWMVFCLLLNMVEGLSGMSAENLQSWLHAAMLYKSYYPTHWEKILMMIQATSYEYHQMEKFTLHTSVLIPNWGGNSRGILYVLEKGIFCT